MAEAKRGRAGEGGGAAAASDIAAMSFEAALAELEQIVKRLEAGQESLEDAIKAYERGAALKRHCEGKLAEAEQRVQMIVERGEGAVETRAMRTE